MKRLLFWLCAMLLLFMPSNPPNPPNEQAHQPVGYKNDISKKLANTVQTREYQYRTSGAIGIYDGKEYIPFSRAAQNVCVVS